jgi:hypothetical protein
MPGEIKARPTLYKGIQMRSRLEADYAALLDGEGSTWDYEPTCFAADGIQWLPDFRVTVAHGEPRLRYIEVKPAEMLHRQCEGDFIGRADAILRRMAVAWESEPDAELKLSFHAYGRAYPDFMVYGMPREPWTCIDNLTPHPTLTIWPGMGQMAALPTARESAREARKAAR